METTDNTAQAKVRAYFWGNSLDKITSDLASGNVPDGLDRDLLIQEYAKYVRPHVPPRSDNASVRDCAGEKVCGARTAYYASKLEDFLNNTIADHDGFCKHIRVKWHRTLQQSLMTLVIRIIRTFAEMDGQTDGRNEYVVQVAKRLAKTLDEE